MTAPHNWRVLRRRSNTFYLTKNAYDKTSLCAGCTKHDCAVTNKPVQMCANFQMTLIFKDRAGLTAPLFNTIRLGSNAATHYLPNDVISLSDGIDVFGLAVVEESIVINNSIEGLLPVARDNHLLIEQDMDARSAATRLTSVVRKFYGPVVMRGNPYLTAIYLRPL